MKRTLVIVAALAMLLAVLAVPGVAKGPPEVIEEFETTFGPNPFIPFCGFDLLVETDLSVLHTHHEIGKDRVRHQTWVSGEDRVYRADDPSKMASGRFNVYDTLTTAVGEEEGELRIQGVHWHLKAPGYGTVFLEAGQLTLDFSQEDPFVGFNGRSDWATGSFDKLCEALS